MEQQERLAVAGAVGCEESHAFCSVGPSPNHPPRPVRPVTPPRRPPLDMLIKRLR
jgi:hypothetical protein